MAKKKSLIILGAMGLCAAAAGAFAFGEARPSAEKINDSALIIGTYLIDFDALDEENQALAEKNAQQENQPKVYYKSELNNGVWYDITDAESVSDITLTNSRIVDNAAIDKLTLTLYFKADGTVVDLTSGEEVSKQEIGGLYYPSEMTELSAVLKHHDIVKNQADAEYDDDDDEEKRKHSIYEKELSELNYLFKPISDDMVSGLKRDLDSLDGVIASSEGGAKEAAISVKVKKRAELENYCREKVCSRIDSIISSLTQNDSSAHSTLISLLSDAESEIMGNMSETQSSIGAEPTDAAGKKQQELQEALLEAAQSGDSKAVEQAAAKLSVLEAMQNGESTDSAAAAELSEELLNDAMSGIEDEISAILNGTHDYYKQGGTGMSEQDVIEQLRTDIADAQQLAKSKAFYNTGSASSEEYNKELAEDLSSLGTLLSALSDSKGSDELSRAVISAAAESADSVLSDAADAQAASKPATAEQKKIDDLKGRIDSAYGEYLDALNSGDSSGADSAASKVEALQEQLDVLRAEAASQVGGLVGEIFSEKNSGSADKEKLRELNAQLMVDKGYLSDVDRALLEQALAALEDMESAAESGSVSKSETAYNKLSSALKNVPDTLLDDSVKSDMLKYTASLLAGDDTPSAEECIDMLNSAKQPPSAAVKELLENVRSAIKEIQQSAESGSQSQKAFDTLNAALQDVPGGVLSDSEKSDILKYSASLLAGEDAPGSEKCEEILNSAEQGISAEDKELLEKAAETVNELDSLEKQGKAGSEQAKSAASELKKLLGKIADNVLDSSAKSDIIEFADSSAADRDSGAGEFAGLLEDIMQDISAADSGEFTQDTTDQGTAIEVIAGIADELFEYKLVVPSLNIYSNTLSIEKGGMVFIDMIAFAREAGLKYYASGEVCVFKGNDVLIELTPGSGVAYVGDKLYAPSAEPYFSGEALYVPLDLLEAGLRLTAETENGTTFMR